MIYVTLPTKKIWISNTNILGKIALLQINTVKVTQCSHVCLTLTVTYRSYTNFHTTWMHFRRFAIKRRVTEIYEFSLTSCYVSQDSPCSSYKYICYISYWSLFLSKRTTWIRSQYMHVYVSGIRISSKRKREKSFAYLSHE